MPWLLRIYRAALWLVWGVSVLGVALLAVATGGWLTRYNDSVTLPNGFVLKREFDFWFDDRDDMFAGDGGTLLARDIEFVCFNDRFVKAVSRERGQSGLFDAKTQGPVPEGRFDVMLKESGLWAKGVTCNGYYTAMIGPGLLYDGMTAPFLPSCASRNLNNIELKDRRWLERPCKPDRWPPIGAEPEGRHRPRW